MINNDLKITLPSSYSDQDSWAITTGVWDNKPVPDERTRLQKFIYKILMFVHDRAEELGSWAYYKAQPYSKGYRPTIDGQSRSYSISVKSMTEGEWRVKLIHSSQGYDLAAVVFFKYSTGAWYRPAFKGSLSECEDIAKILNQTMQEQEDAQH